MQTTAPDLFSASGGCALACAHASDAAPAPLTGIAALASQSEEIEYRNDVDYRALETRSALNRVQGSRVSFEWSINPYRGCEFACQYCYARYTHEFMEHHDTEQFERRIYVKSRAAAQLQLELARGRVPLGKQIVIGTATDPWQPAEKRHGITREILQVLTRFSGYRIEFITKSDLLLRDLDLLREIGKRHGLKINMTVTTVDADLARKLEPRAVTPRRRLEAVRRLREAGICAGVHLMPVLPGITDAEPAIEAVVRAAAEHRASFVASAVLFLTDQPRRHYFRFIERDYPHLLTFYHRLYDKGSKAPDDYRERVQRMASRVRARYDMPSEAECEIPDGPGLRTEQSQLF